MEEAKKRDGQEGEGGGERGGGGVFFSAEKEKEEQEEAPEDLGTTSSSGVGPQLQFLDKVVFVAAQRQILMVVQGLRLRPVSGSHLFACLACCLVRHCIHIVRPFTGR